MNNQNQKRLSSNPNLGRRQRKKKDKNIENSVETTSSVSSTTTSSWKSNLSREKLINRRLPATKPTVSIAFPSSLISKSQAEVKTMIVGQISRALALFEIDEVIVFIDTVTEQTSTDIDRSDSHLICRLLQYMETPSYLRRSLFPFHHSFKYVGLLPSLDMPHHMGKNDDSWYREGITVSSSKQDKSLVDVGLDSLLTVDKTLPTGIRVSVKLDSTSLPLSGTLVSPFTPRKVHGLYWGYETRLANSFNDTFTESSFKSSDGNPEPYDCIIGCTESGSSQIDASQIPKFKHCLIVFGGEKGIEGCAEADESFKLSAQNVHTMFTMWLNPHKTGGCKSVRTEEAILISLSKLNSVLQGDV